MSTILIADDEENIRAELADVLSDNGYRVITTSDGVSALAQLKLNEVQLVITDLRMPKGDGLELIRKGRESSPETQFIVMTAFGTMEAAIEAMRAGATDFLIKPLSINELIAKVGRITENAELRSANRMLKRDLDRKLGPLDMVGSSPLLARIRQLIQKVAPTRSAVLITGESGTGKELIARAIHALGVSKSQPFVPINCAAIPETLLESELFGHQKGAFTGAVANTDGLFKSARKGTIFLDEIGEMSMPLQAKLLRIFEDHSMTPVGSTKCIPFEARVITATNRNLKQAIQEKTFREDLYFRLAVVELHAPTLRERSEDIPLLAAHFLRRFNHELNRQYSGIDVTALNRLKSMPWKGNIRELQNVIERAMIVGNEPLLMEFDLSSPALAGVPVSLDIKDLKEAVRQFEHLHVKNVLASCGDDKRNAAKELCISLSSLYRYLGEQSSEEM